MRTLASVLILFVVLGVGCTPTLKQLESLPATETVSAPIEHDVVLPLDFNGTIGYETVYKRFGEYAADRFTGYHTGEDAEGPSENLSGKDVNPVFVRAVADGTVVYEKWVSGYGGVMVLQHQFDGVDVQTLYGHVALSTATVHLGDTVTKGQTIVQLGVDKSRDTDGERQHLHFGVYEGTEVKLEGYVQTAETLAGWINPYDFFQAHHAFETGAQIPDPTSSEWTLSQNLWYPTQPRRDVALYRTKWGELSFELPPDWDVEYVPSTNALNLYQVSGSGTAMSRSQMMIWSVKATDFLAPVPGANVLVATDAVVGDESYPARVYAVSPTLTAEEYQDKNFDHSKDDSRVITEFYRVGDSRVYLIEANTEHVTDWAEPERVLATLHINN